MAIKHMNIKSMNIVGAKPKPATEPKIAPIENMTKTAPVAPDPATETTSAFDLALAEPVAEPVAKPAADPPAEPEAKPSRRKKSE